MFTEIQNQILLAGFFAARESKILTFLSLSPVVVLWCKDKTGDALEKTGDALQKTGGALGRAGGAAD